MNKYNKIKLITIGILFICAIFLSNQFLYMIAKGFPDTIVPYYDAKHNIIEDVNCISKGLPPLNPFMYWIYFIIINSILFGMIFAGVKSDE